MWQMKTLAATDVDGGYVLFMVGSSGAISGEKKFLTAR